MVFHKDYLILSDRYIKILKLKKNWLRLMRMMNLRISEMFFTPIAYCRMAEITNQLQNPKSFTNQYF
ncbi:MAG: hypothetical protein F6K15_32745 [Okeania sp. SIO2B3]|nr:hypothetical protein [Okeania sp. SIO2B3]